MWNRQILKENAKIAFKRNYWECVATSIIAAILCGEVGNVISTVRDVAQEEQSLISNEFTFILLIFTVFGSIIGMLFSVLVGNIIEVGKSRYYMENREHHTRVSQLFYGFRNGRYSNIILIMLLRDIFVFLWSLLFLIPGIIKGFSYFCIPYILSENPEMDRKRAFELSMQMMDGHKADVFVLGLSFLGWLLLGVLTCGILNIFYVSPYSDATFAEFYAAVKAEAIQKGITSEIELPGHFYETL